MRVLLEAGASVEEVDADKTTALQWICKQGHHAKCAEALISRKADINVLDKISYSLLALVAKAGASANAPDLMRLLLANGANVNTQTKSKTSPLAHYAYYSKELGDPHDAEIVRILVEAKADVNARNKYSNSALKFIAQRGTSPQVMSALLEHGADPNILDTHVCMCVCARMCACCSGIC